MTIEITRFRSLTDVRGTRCELSSLRALVARPMIASAKECLAGWAPAIYEDNSRADDKRAISLSALVIEVDHGTTVDQAVALWNRFRGLLYTTFSHRIDAHRFRIVLPLARFIAPGEHATLWRWAERFARMHGQEIDPHTKDAKRFWFVPGHASGALFEVRELGGEILDPDPLITNQLEHDRTVRAATKPQISMRSAFTTSSVVDRARSYLARVPGAISGEGGHQTTWRATLALVRGFDLDPVVALELLRDWNERCVPPWSENELVHKVKSAANARDVATGYLLDGSRRVA